MSYKNAKVGSDAWWQQKIDNGVVKSKPGLGVCMFCANKMKQNSKDSICNNCIESKLR
jgi:hypothetical protein